MSQVKEESFLPAIYDILKFVDKDPAELQGKVAELRAQLQAAREEVERLPGVDLSPEEQQRVVEGLRRQLVSKAELLRKYKQLSVFDTPTA